MQIDSFTTNHWFQSMISANVEHLIRNASLRQLQIFEMVARKGSFTRAAEALFLTQPTVSMQVKKLADILGHPLFESVGKRTTLTQAGEVAHACCRDIFDALHRCHMTLAEMSGLMWGRLRLSVVTTAEYFAPRVLGVFCERHPGIDIELQVLNRKALLERLAGNLDDLSILGQPPEGADMEAVAFLDNPQVALAGREHPLVRERNIPLARLAREPMIMREAGSGTRKFVERLFQEADLPLRIRMELGSNEAIKQAVAGGLGVSILSAHTLSLLGDSPLLHVLDVQGFPIMRQWHLVHPAGKELSPVARAFSEFLLHEGASLVSPIRFDQSGSNK